MHAIEVLAQKVLTYCISDPFQPPNVHWYRVDLDKHAARNALQRVHEVRDETGPGKVPHGRDADHGARHGDVLVHERHREKDKELPHVAVEAGHKVHEDGEEERHGHVLGRQAGEPAREHKGKRVDAALGRLAVKGGNVNRHAVDFEDEDEVALQPGGGVKAALAGADACLVAPEVEEEVPRHDAHEDGLHDGRRHAQRVAVRHLERPVRQDAHLSPEAGVLFRVRLAPAVSTISRRGQRLEAVRALLPPCRLKGLDPCAALLLQLWRAVVDRRNVNDVLRRVDKRRQRKPLPAKPGEAVRDGARVHGTPARQHDEVVKEIPDLRARLVDRGDDGAPLARERLERAHQLKRARGIEPRRRLVEEQHRRVGQQLDADADATLLAAGAPAVLRVADARVGALLEAQLADDLVDDAVAVTRRRGRREAQVGRVLQRLADRQRGQQDVLLHDVCVSHAVHAGHAVEGRDAGLAEARAAHPLGHGVEQRRLAGPAAADDGREGAGLEVGVDGVQQALDARRRLEAASEQLRVGGRLEP